MEQSLKNTRSNLGFSINSSIGTATVRAQNGFKQEYLSWEGGIKFGYFSDIFFYVEAGLDLAELILDDRNEDDDNIYHYHNDNPHDSDYNNNDYHNNNYHNNNYHNNNYHNNDYDESNNIDAYVGIGLGIKFGHIQIETFARLREIDSTNWEAENHIYTGIQTSLSF